MYRPRRPPNTPVERPLKRRARRALGRAALMLSMAPGAAPTAFPSFRSPGYERGQAPAPAAARNFRIARRPRPLDGSALELGALDSGSLNLGSSTEVCVLGRLEPPLAEEPAQGAAQTRRFEWSAPSAGHYLLEFASHAEPPQSFALQVRNGSDGVELYQGETSALGLQLRCESQVRIEVCVGHPLFETPDTAAGGFELQISALG